MKVLITLDLSQRHMPGVDLLGQLIRDAVRDFNRTARAEAALRHVFCMSDEHYFRLARITPLLSGQYPGEDVDPCTHGANGAERSAN